MHIRVCIHYFVMLEYTCMYICTKMYITVSTRFYLKNGPYRNCCMFTMPVSSDPLTTYSN